MQTPKSRLYFIAIVPNEPAYENVSAMKEYMSKNFNSHAALRSPPHITLIPPFRCNEENEKLISIALQSFATVQKPFELALDGFDCFKPRVIFVKNSENSELIELQAKLKTNLQQAINLKSESDDSRPFHPHMTIAFKDLSKAAFHEAWAEFKDKPYKATFEVNSIELLKHDGKKWEVISSCFFT